jgi:hypothetical protein
MPSSDMRTTTKRWTIPAIDPPTRCKQSCIRFFDRHCVLAVTFRFSGNEVETLSKMLDGKRFRSRQLYSVTMLSSELFIYQNHHFCSF